MKCIERYVIERGANYESFNSVIPFVYNYDIATQFQLAYTNAKLQTYCMLYVIATEE